MAWRTGQEIRRCTRWGQEAEFGAKDEPDKLETNAEGYLLHSGLEQLGQRAEEFRANHESNQLSNEAESYRMPVCFMGLGQKAEEFGAQKSRSRREL